ncbi:MAG: Ezrin/radixin/moesin family protein [Bacteroidetes bacterium]|nr:MAG: Ezrin/radixin/moesin family protein [Bacteroidota bacterium]
MVLTLSLLIGFSVSAQLSKEEKKEWKAKYKAYKKDLEGFKDLVEENGTLKSQLSTSKRQLTTLQSQMGDKDAKIAELQDQVTRMRAQVAAAKDAELEAKNAVGTSKPSKVSKSPISMDGIIFKVQIGAFAKKDMSKFFDNNPMFSGEDENGMQKITIGFFKDYWEADTFKKYLREMGVKDAWIVPFKDGKRVPIKDVLEGVI